MSTGNINFVTVSVESFRFVCLIFCSLDKPNYDTPDRSNLSSDSSEARLYAELETHFYRATYTKRGIGLCYANSVCPSVRLPVTRVDCIKTAERIIEIL